MAADRKDSRPETLARVRAALAYTTRPQTEIAAALDVADRTLENWKVSGIQRPNVNLPIIARECGLPVEFFYADFTRLSEIVPPTTEQGAAKPPALPLLPGETEADAPGTQAG